MNKYLYYGILLFSFCKTYAQPKVIWEKKVGGEHAEYLNNSIATPDYGFLLLGSSTSDATGDKSKRNQGGLDYFIWKMDENGKQEWQQSFGGNGNDQLINGVNTPDGGFILIGSSNSDKTGDKSDENFGFEDVWVIKLNAAGLIEWQKTIGGSGNEIPVTIINTNDKGYLIGSVSNSLPNEIKKSELIGSNDYWLIKLDNDGNVEWENTYGGDNNDLLLDIIETKDNYIVFGNSNSPSNERTKVLENDYTSGWVITLNKEGEILKEQIFSESENRIISIQSSNDEYLLSLQETINKDKIKVLKFNERFEEVESIELKIDPKQSIRNVNLIDENYILSSNIISTTINNNQQEQFISSKYSSTSINKNGSKNWNKTFGEDGYSYLEKTLKTRDGSLILFGNSTSKSSSNVLADFYLVKIGKEVNKEEEKRKYIEAYPNPTDDFVNVLINTDFKEATIEVYNLVGQKLQSKNVKYRTTPISLGDYSGGVYILKINYDNQTESIKIIKK